jgi:2'-5' RNA ligase
MAGDKIRLFVAARVPDMILQRLASATEELRKEFPDARWVPISNQHVTLKFVGSFGRANLDEAQAAVVAATTGSSPTDISLGGIGAFPSARRIRVLWAGLDDPTGMMAELAGKLDNAFEALGVTREGRDFSAHITIARFPAPVARSEPLPKLALGDLSFRLASVELFSSRLSPHGARYEILRSFPLDG